MINLYEPIHPLTPNFYYFELCSRYKQGIYLPPDDLKLNYMSLAFRLQIIRNYINKPIHITSWYRNPEHNKMIGGSDISRHLYGDAIDGFIRGESIASIIQLFYDFGFNRIGIYPTESISTRFHIDTKPEVSTYWFNDGSKNEYFDDYREFYNTLKDIRADFQKIITV